MLLSSSPGGAPLFLRRYGLGETAAEAAALAVKSQNLKALQVALVNLSNATHNPAINPGDTSGGLFSGLPSDKTMSSVAAAMALIGPKLPQWANIGLSIALGIGATTDQAKNYVLSYAPELTKAAIAATIAAPYYTKPPAATPTSEVPTIFATAGPWYKTWWGIGAIAVGALGVLSLLAARRQAA